MYKWLLSIPAVQKLLDSIINQGFSVLLLLFAVGWFGYKNELQRTESDKKIQRLEAKVENINNHLLEYYKVDRRKSDAVIDRATTVLERVEKKLIE